MKLNKTILIRVSEKNSKGKLIFLFLNSVLKKPLYFSVEPAKTYINESGDTLEQFILASIVPPSNK